MRIAIVGAGISGLVTAYLLHRKHEITVFESQDYAGGHSHTVSVPSEDGSFRIDTGFIVYNEENYPNFTRLLRKLGVKSEATSMSFSVRCEATGLEYNGTSLNALYAQRVNFFKPGFQRMVFDILRFYRHAPKFLEEKNGKLSIGEFIDGEGYSHHFTQKHLIPLGSAIWSCSPEQLKDFPAHFLLNFFEKHGFLRLSRRPSWRIVSGGSFHYVEKLTSNFPSRIRLKTPVTGVRRHRGRVWVTTERRQPEPFDAVVLAVHSDQALNILSDPTEVEREVLSAIPYQENEVVLHTDSTLLPGTPLTRASWNYHLLPSPPSRPVVTYSMNRLQNLSARREYCVTLNRTSEIHPSLILDQFRYHHPIFTADAVEAQKRWDAISTNRTLFCGAYWGWGFHEDGVNSALRVASRFGVGSL